MYTVYTQLFGTYLTDNIDRACKMVHYLLDNSYQEKVKNGKPFLLICKHLCSYAARPRPLSYLYWHRYCNCIPHGYIAIVIYVASIY